MTYGLYDNSDKNKSSVIEYCNAISLENKFKLGARKFEDI